MDTFQPKLEMYLIKLMLKIKYPLERFNKVDLSTLFLSMLCLWS
jgi:hypothetical protein